MQQDILTVGLGNRSYDIVIGPDLIDRVGDVLNSIVVDRHIVIVSDNNVAKLHLARLEAGFKPYAQKINHFALTAGEASKSFTILSRLIDNILALGIDRSVVLIAFGGGVIGDLVGFAAATLLRGVDFVQIPTSLLAQVDSSVGGKTGINTVAGKNLVGAFHQPRAVLIDTSLLATLPVRELRAGYAEVVKYGLLGNDQFFVWLEENSAAVLALKPDAITHAIISSCKAKARIVEADERESGKRALLNLGHTFAHAFEAEAGYDGSLLHGEAVAVGMGLAFDLSVNLGICASDDAARCKAHLQAVGLPATQASIAAGNVTASRLINHMKHDKKMHNGKMYFVLVRAIGDAFVSGDVSLNMVRALLERDRNAL